MAPAGFTTHYCLSFSRSKNWAKFRNALDRHVLNPGEVSCHRRQQFLIQKNELSQNSLELNVISARFPVHPGQMDRTQSAEECDGWRFANSVCRSNCTRVLMIYAFRRCFQIVISRLCPENGSYFYGLA